MKAILTVGCPNSGHDQVFELLTRAGVSCAHPGRMANLPPQALQEKLLHSQEVDLNADVPLQQVQPGKLWSELAADLFLPNVAQAVWGWADHQTAALMDFWLEFDSQVHLLLVFNSPQRFLSQGLTKNSVAISHAADSMLRLWMRWNTALLRFFHRHPERCLLVNGSRAQERPDELLDVLASRWQIGALNAPTPIDESNDEQQCLYEHLIHELIGDQHSVWALNQELEDAASLQLNRPGGLGSDARAALTAWMNLRADLDNLTQANASALAKVSEGNVLSTQLQHENDLLLLQLHQAQEEAEDYFLRYQDLDHRRQIRASDFAAEFWRVHQPIGLQLDMRQDVASNNWYHAEPDGRWAGPANLSTISMPPLQEGTYLLELDVVDAMDIDIVKSMRVEVLDQSNSVDVMYIGRESDYPVVCTTHIYIALEASSTQWEIGLRFDRTIRPADAGGDDHRHLAVRLRTLRLVKLS